MERSTLGMMTLALATALSVVSLAHAEGDPAASDANATVLDYAKSVKSKLDAVRSKAGDQKPSYPFGHFLKLPPPPPPENEAGEPVVAIVLPPEIKANGLMNLGGTTVVVMQDGTHKVGDVVLGAKITAISAKEVSLNYRGKAFKIPVR